METIDPLDLQHVFCGISIYYTCSGILSHDSMNWSNPERLRKCVIDTRKLPRGCDVS